MKTRVQLVLEALGIEAIHRGKQWWAKCPNLAHDDRHPSWRIRDEAGSARDGYHACPPCGFEGGLIGLIGHVQKVSWREARELLKKIEEGVPIVWKPPPISTEIVTKRKGFELRAGVTVAPFADWPPMARAYALGRGITEAQVDKWGIGYADVGQLANRLVIVTRDGKGRVRNYTARTYVDHPKRYFEPEHWEKADRNVMFGEQHWPQCDRSHWSAVVVEGAFKGLAVDRAIQGVALAATAGSALMPGYLPKLVQFGEVIVSTDADETGDRIAEDLIFLLRKHNVRHRRARPRDGIDHDEMAPEDLRAMLDVTRAA